MPHAAASRRSKVVSLNEKLGIITILAVVSLAACSDRPAAASPDSTPTAGRSAADVLPDVLATVGREDITAAEIRENVALELERLSIEHDRAQAALLEEALRDAIRRRLFDAEAARQGVSRDELVAAEAGDRLEPTPAEVEAWYVANPDRVGRRTLEFMAPRIAQSLREERLAAATRALESRLSRTYGVQVMLPSYQLPMNNEGAPHTGGREARVTLVEFSDFECSFCGRFAQTLKRIQAEFGDDVRIVYRQFPLTRLHPDAFKAAEASLCAHEQGQFWPMHDAMFEQQGRLQVSELKLLAGRLGLDQRRFDSCLDTGRFVEQVQNDMREGRVIGVTGTPALFVNGVPLRSGAQPYAVVAEAVRDALARANR